MATPIPSFPQIQSADLGERELKLFMKTKTDKLDNVQVRLVSLRELQSQTQEELDALLPSAEGATARPKGGGVQGRVVTLFPSFPQIY
jgi:hypothetical protein